MPEYRLKLDVAALKPGQKQEAEVEGLDGVKVLLLNVGGDVSAVSAKCTHYGAPLVKGVLSPSGRLTCPWHGACFNAKTGDVEDAPALDALATFAVSSRDGSWYVSGEEAAFKGGKRTPATCPAQSRTAASDHVVVVGGGSGTLGVVQGLGEAGFPGSVTVISAEGNYPIDRPKLSKSLMTDVAKLTWRDADWFKANNIRWVDGEVVGVDFAAKTVATKNGDSYSYTKLVLATGGQPKNLPLDGFKTLENIFTLRTVASAAKIADAVGDQGRKIVVVGSSFIGMELAVALNKNNNSVAVVGMEKVPLERVLGERVGAGLQSMLESKGIKFHMSADVEKAEPSAADSSKVGCVVLKDGTRIEADVVLLGVGVKPATDFLRSQDGDKEGAAVVKLEEDGSLKTDEQFAVEGLDGVYAVGDIATYPYHGPGGQGTPIRIEHWNVAQNSGRAVASHIASTTSATSGSTAVTHKPENFIPVFWSALGSQLRYCGSGAVNGGWDDVVVDGDVAAAKFVAYYCKADTVVAVASMGRDPVVMKSMELMRRGAMMGKSELAKGQVGQEVLQVAL